MTASNWTRIPLTAKLSHEIARPAHYRVRVRRAGGIRWSGWGDLQRIGLVRVPDNSRVERARLDIPRQTMRRPV